MINMRRYATLMLMLSSMLLTISFIGACYAVELDNSEAIERNKFYQGISAVKYEISIKQYDQFSRILTLDWHAKFVSNIVEELNSAMKLKYPDQRYVLTLGGSGEDVHTVVAKIEIQVSPKRENYNNVQVTMSIFNNKKNTAGKSNSRNVRALPSRFFDFNFKQAKLTETEQRILLTTIWPLINGLPTYLNTRNH
jgi:hypothetical protein